MPADEEDQPSLQPGGPLSDETQPLLQDGARRGDDRELLSFEKGDTENPRNWSHTKKMVNVATVAAMAIVSPLASSMFSPGIDQIAEGLNTTTSQVIACTTGFVVMLGIGPLILVGSVLCEQQLYVTVCSTNSHRHP